jgi:hypothetical protein
VAKLRRSTDDPAPGGIRNTRALSWLLYVVDDGAGRHTSTPSPTTYTQADVGWHGFLPVALRLGMRGAREVVQAAFADDWVRSVRVGVVQ